MKRILVSLIFSVLLLLPVGAQERAVREAAPQDLVKSLEMPLFWKTTEPLSCIGMQNLPMCRKIFLQENNNGNNRKDRRFVGPGIR